MKRTTLYLAVSAILVDTAAILVGMIVAYNLRAQGAELYFWPFYQYVWFIVGIIPVWLLLFASQGLYNPANFPSGWSAFGRQLIGLLSGWGVMIIVLYLWRTPQTAAFPRLVIGYGLFSTLFFVAFGRILLNSFGHLLRRAGVGVMRTVVLSRSPQNDFIHKLSNARTGRKVVAVLDEGTPHSLAALYKKERFDELIVAEAGSSETELLSLANWAEEHHCNFVLIPSLLAVRTTNVEVGTLAGTPVMLVRRTPLDGWGRVFKRLMDIVIVLPIIIILVPLYVLLFLLVKISSRGPAIFRQARIGQDGRTFYIHKFRSMYVDGDKRFKKIGAWSTDEKTDPRVTGFGRLLRRTNLDELPQLFDILVGRMSIVGPRPEQPQYVEKFSKEVPEYLKRHNVKSGLTGWAQVNGLRGDTSIPERVKYDLFYIENWSILFDLRIMLATVVYLLRRPVLPE